ncbi:MAG: hypothetical protein HW421_2170 [Ignavibacteria bacterium]|nr:hypothetical protein [Ignavibacteria bacterium]
MAEDLNSLKKVHVLHSEFLGKETEIAIYGHYGISIVMFPTFTDHYLENEANGIIESIAHNIKIGTCRVFSIPGIMEESWHNYNIDQSSRSKRHFEYNQYIEQEVIPFIYYENGGAVPIITCGASLGAFFAANSYFRRPDIFLGTIAMSGSYNLDFHTNGFFDENCYFNSPVHYLPNLNDSFWMSYLYSRRHVYLLSGSGEGENPHFSQQLSDILNTKGIPHSLDVWGAEFGHTIDTWKKMLPQFLSQKF